MNGAAITEAEFKKLCDHYDCQTEAAVPCDLRLVLYSGIFEEGRPTNRIVNVNKPWEVRIWWCLSGSLREALCGVWCPSVHVESIGKGPEFSLSVPHFEYDCNNSCWYVVIPGSGITPSDCTTPYKVVVTLTSLSMCKRPLPINGFCDLRIVQFFAA